jgi:hypothetical protein
MNFASLEDPVLYQMAFEDFNHEIWSLEALPILVCVLFIHNLFNETFTSSRSST